MSSADTGAVLERAIAEDPDDLAAHSAYADWLTQQGDPRGELIQVQLVLEGAGLSVDDRKNLKTREAELFQAHHKEWLGRLAGEAVPGDAGTAAILAEGGPLHIGLRRGWLDQIRLPELHPDLAEMLVSAPIARMVRRLVIAANCYDADQDVASNFLTSWPGLANIRFFQLGEENERFSAAEVDVVALIKHMPRLEELHLFAGFLETEPLFSLSVLTRLRVLQINHAEECPLERLAANPAFSRLEQLLLHPHAALPGGGAFLTLDGVRALVQSPHFRLTHLRLHMCDMGDEGCEVIVQSGALKHLKVLDVEFGRITDAGAAILAACPDLAKLELLNISANRLTDAGINLLRRATPHCQASAQYPPILHGDDYLMEGDWE